jgi:hypothetical protein
MKTSVSPSPRLPVSRALLLPFFILSLLALATTACTRTSATPPPTPPPPASATAAHYKAGHGIQLSPAARAFVGIATADFATRLPTAAMLRTVKGDFVYVANGPWFLRTPVTLGAADSTSFALKEGLYEGDTFVTHGVRALWLAELQATNGGVGCADGH